MLKVVSKCLRHKNAQRAKATLKTIEDDRFTLSTLKTIEDDRFTLSTLKPIEDNRFTLSTLKTIEDNRFTLRGIKKGTATRPRSTEGPLPPPASLEQIAMPLFRLM